MIGAPELTNALVQTAVGGAETDCALILKVMAPRIRLMVAARLSPAAHQQDALDDTTQQVLIALTTGLPSLKDQSVTGLNAFASGIVNRKVADLLEGRENGKRPRPRAASLDSTVATLSGAGPLWTFLSVSGTSPGSAVERVEEARRALEELGRLKAVYREIITLAFFDQLPTREIARCLNTSPRAASMLLLRAMRTLRRNLTGSSVVGRPHGQPA